jgi:hypothetical protein
MEKYFEGASQKYYNGLKLSDAHPENYFQVIYKYLKKIQFIFYRMEQHLSLKKKLVLTVTDFQNSLPLINQFQNVLLFTTQNGAFFGTSVKEIKNLTKIC